MPFIHPTAQPFICLLLTHPCHHQPRSDPGFPRVRAPRGSKAPRSRRVAMLGRAAGKGHGSPAGRRSRDAREHHGSWRHVGPGPWGSGSCVLVHHGDVPVLHELEGQGSHLKTGGRGLAAHLPIAQAEELPYKALSDQEPRAWEQPARPPSMQHDSLLSKVLGFVQSPCCMQTDG